MAFRFPQEHTRSVRVSFPDPFEVDKESSFIAQFRHISKKEVLSWGDAESVDWDQVVRDNLCGFEIEGLDFSPETVDLLLNTQDVDDALQSAARVVYYGRLKMREVERISNMPPEILIPLMRRAQEQKTGN